MKLKQKKNAKITLSDKIADALTLKPRADIEDDQVFGTKPKTLSRADFGSSDSEDEAAISDFRKRNVNLLSDVSKKYEGQVVSRNDLAQSDSEVSDGNDDNISSDDEELPQNGKQKIGGSSDSESEGQTLSQFRLDSDSEIESDEDTNDKIIQLKKQIHDNDDDVDDDSDAESDNYSITQPKNKKTATADSVANFMKQIQASDDDDDDSDAESDDYSINQSKKKDTDSDAESEEEDEGYDISQLDEPMLENFEHVKKQNISEEAKKGICVRNQLLVWEGLLEMRIHLQRCVSTANQMPMPETYVELQKINKFAEESNAAKANIANVLDKLLSLQHLLLKNFPETKSLSTKKSDKDTKQDKKEESDEEIPSDTDNEEIPSDTEPEDNEETKSPAKTEKTAPVKKRKLGDYESELSTIHKSFKNFRDTSIQKWNDKTRLATATNIKNQPTNTILQQITYILSDREKLIKRTQLKRSEYDIVGYKKEPTKQENEDQNGEINPVTRSRKDDDEYIPEIFDDSDFYHQLLRELIECKSADISDPVQLSRQWIALQQMRSKMKRKVDTKATKGRKIKYVVHNKLVNYMASEKCLTWTDESTNELYSSLFGKLFEHNNAGLNGNVGNVFQLN